MTVLAIFTQMSLGYAETVETMKPYNTTTMLSVGRMLEKLHSHLPKKI